MKTRIYPKNESEGKDKNLFEAQLAGRNERETRSQFTHTINKKKIKTCLKRCWLVEMRGRLVHNLLTQSIRKRS